MGNLTDYAKSELALIGYDEKCEAPNSWIRDNVLELVELFSKQGHSGSSAPQVINLFEKVASYKPLKPIMCTDDEFVEVGDLARQNKRCSAVFRDSEGKPYYIDAIIWKTQNGGCFGDSADNIRGRQYIKLPFVPKTFYIDVIEEEVAPDDWELRIKDLSQLEQVWEYFEKSDEFSTYKPVTQEEINQRIKEHEEKYSRSVSNIDDVATFNQPISES